MTSLLINLLLILLIAGVIWWAITQIPIPHPFGLIVKVVFLIVLILVLFNLLTGGGLRLA